MRKLLFLAAALLVIAAVLWTLGARQLSWKSPWQAIAPDATRSSSQAGGADQPAAGSHKGLRTTSPQADDRALLPPEDAPASVSYAPLKQLADAGSARAACRLAFELLRCQALLEGPAVRSSLEKRESSADSHGMGEAANMIAGTQIEAATRELDCKKLPAAAFHEASDYLYQAASAGNAAAQVRYISGQMFGSIADEALPVSNLSLLHHPEFERWHRSAPAMANSMLVAHPSVGITLLGRAYGSDRLPFDALIPDDPVQQWVYVEAARRIDGLPARSPAQFDVVSRNRIPVLEKELARVVPADAPRELALVNAVLAPGSSLGDWSASGCE